MPFTSVPVAQEVRVRVHDELAGQRLRALGGLILLGGLGTRDVEQPAVDLVHGDERGGHAGGGREERATAHALLARQVVAERLHARFDLALRAGLRGGEVFVARHDLRRDRARERVGLSG
jgi:hypothetical protein